MRPIDAEPVIEMLKRLRRMADSHRRDLDLLNLQQLLEAAPVLDSVDNAGGATMKWVSVEDRLPEIKDHHVSDPVIAYCAEQEMVAVTELEENFFGGFVFGIERTDPRGEDDPVEVTHWIPLPAPPKEATE